MWILLSAILALFGGLTVFNAPARSRRHAAERDAVLQALEHFQAYATETSVLSALERLSPERMSPRILRAHLVALEEDGAVLAYTSGAPESLVRRYRLGVTVPRDPPLASSEPRGSRALTVYYDGSCPLCAAEISIYKRAYGAQVLTFLDRTSPDTMLPPDLTPQSALSHFHVRDASGTLFSGAAAFALLWRALPRWRWLGQLVGADPLLPLAERAYQTFLPLRPHFARLIVVFGFSPAERSLGRQAGPARWPKWHGD